MTISRSPDPTFWIRTTITGPRFTKSILFQYPELRKLHDYGGARVAPQIDCVLVLRVLLVTKTAVIAATSTTATAR